MEHVPSAFYLTILGLACIAAAPLFLFQKHDSVFCATPLLLLLGLSILIIGLAGLECLYYLLGTFVFRICSVGNQSQLAM